jgi:hypothetical protein
MPPPSLLSDELLRQLIAVGQVDVLAGVPSHNNASSIATTVGAIQTAFARYFPRERTVLVNSDGGSTDGTPDLVRDAGSADSGTVSAAHSLRTAHRVSAPYHGLPGKGTALRSLFAAADLLQARALVVLDPETVSVTPEWVRALVRPILADQCDFVAPVYARHALDGPLVTQLLRPVVRAAWGLQIREPVPGEFGCSGRFASQALQRVPWDTDVARDLPDTLLTGLAIAGGFRLGQAALGPRVSAPRDARPALPAVLQQVVGAIFLDLERHAARWLDRQGSEAIPTFGDLGPAPDPAAPLDAEAMAAAFRAGVADLHPVLEPILAPETLAAVQGLAATTGPPAFDDALWARTVFEFLAAYHRRVIHADHLMQALVPLYLGRTAAFVARGERDAARAESELEGLALEFERAKPDLVRRWDPERGR